MKKFLYLFILLMLAGLSAKSQIGPMVITTDNGTAIRGGNPSWPDNADYIEGTRNLYDDFRSGAVYYKDNSDIFQVPLRLNIYNDEFEYIKNDTLFAIENATQLEKVVMDNQVFIYLEPDSEKDASGYVIKWNTDLPAVITKMKMGFYSKESNVLGTKPKRFEREEDKHFIMNSDLEIVRITSVNNLIKLLNSHSSELKRYAKSEKISGRKPAEMAKILDYYQKLGQDL